VRHITCTSIADTISLNLEEVLRSVAYLEVKAEGDSSMPCGSPGRKRCRPALPDLRTMAKARLPKSQSLVTQPIVPRYKNA
jgi:hypothetical protein